MKFKVGDKVRVRKDLEVGKIYGNYEFKEAMEKFKGKLAIIQEVWGYHNDLDRDYGENFWTDEMLEPVAENNAEVAENKDENTDEVSINSVESIDQFTKDDFKFGDIVTLRNGDVLIFTGVATMRNSADMEFYLNAYDDTDFYTGDDNLDIMRVQRYVNEVGFDTYQLKTLYYRKEEILTDKEKEYLSKFIKPFRNRIREISKMNYKNEEWLLFILNRENGIENFSLPSFDKNTIYKGMETNKAYTLEELGL